MNEILTQLFGDAVTDELLSRFNAELGKRFVAKADYNTKLEEIKTLKKKQEDLEGKISEMTESASSNEDYKSQLEALQKQIKDAEIAAQKEAEEKALTDAIVSVFGDAKFTSDYVRNGLIADMKAEIQKPENKGKGYAEIYAALTKDKEGIFQNPNPPADMGGMGGIPPKTSDLDDLDMAAYIAARNQQKG